MRRGIGGKKQNVMTTIKLEFQKSSNPVDYNTLENMRTFKNFSFNCSSSQIMKRLDKSDALEIIDRLKAGEEIEIED
jgi:hypothetical protein